MLIEDSHCSVIMVNQSNKYPVPYLIYVTWLEKWTKFFYNVLWEFHAERIFFSHVEACNLSINQMLIKAWHKPSSHRRNGKIFKPVSPQRVYIFCNLKHYLPLGCFQVTQLQSEQKRIQSTSPHKFDPSQTWIHQRF